MKQVGSVISSGKLLLRLCMFVVAPRQWIYWFPIYSIHSHMLNNFKNLTLPPLVHKFIRLDLVFGNNITLLKWRVRKSEWRLYHLTFSPPPPPWRGRTCLINLPVPISIANRGIALTGTPSQNPIICPEMGILEVMVILLMLKRYWTSWPWSTNFSEGINGEEDF